MLPHVPMGDLPSPAEPELQPTPSHLHGGCLQILYRKSARKEVNGKLLRVFVELEGSRALVTVAEEWVAALPLFPYFNTLRSGSPGRVFSAAPTLSHLSYCLRK
jgi:hypothetical protein